MLGHDPVARIVDSAFPQVARAYHEGATQRWIANRLMGVRMMSNPAITPPRWTSADLELMPDDGKRYEIIVGELYVSKQPQE